MKYRNLLRNVRNWPQFLWFKLFPERHAAYVFTLQPTPLQVTMPRTMVVLFKEIFLQEAYEPTIRELTTETPVVLDVGGNMGYFALYTFLRKPKAQVHSFEPIETNLRYLNAHRQAHPALNWQAHQLAVADRSGTLDFFYDESQSPEGINTDASLFSSGELGSTTTRHRRVSVAAIRLSDWMAAQQITRCDLLKLDCEGDEYGILYTLSDEVFAQIGLIVAEVHAMKNPEENIDALAEFLRTKRYDVRTEYGNMLYAKRRP